MKFKHTFHVFVANFSVTYKQLLYRLVIMLVFSGIAIACVYPFVGSLIASEELNTLVNGVRDFIAKLIDGDVEALRGISDKVEKAYTQFIYLLQTRMVQLVLAGLLLLLVYIIEKWFAGIGNYATAAVINDKMALRANSPFMGTLIKNLREAAVYNLIYVPLSVLYDIIIVAAMFAFVYYLVFMKVLPLLIGVFFFMLIVVVAISFKMTFTCDWLPALIRGKMGQQNSFKYTFSRKNKKTFNVFSNFVVLVLIIMSVNITAFLTTFGVGLLLTIPASYVILVSFELVNYYDREEIKYFVDKNTVIKPAKESVITREQFFKGDFE